MNSAAAPARFFLPWFTASGSSLRRQKSRSTISKRRRPDSPGWGRGSPRRAGAVGAAGMDWHHLVEAWAAGDEAASAAAVNRLCRIGHTSGADALAGFALGGGSVIPP